ncbi:ABC transporter ATP-binding protein [Xinfangfangia sp. D13-10-4-6]|uniref:ABC transporter ATP-binding protein n=1 Tax=Pseudogemmobacter hezensis TaxID=2737662 RepID=UPI001555FCF8|nr:ABC transporter ATP-binding protein [Pseudogemmobacter hezensis]NPD17560.1 ABC transporter ATP-binding protein [Pseudogemmobacter hezensis]
MKVSLQGLSWSARQRIIVDDVTLEIASGETFGLVGANGSGKSTLLRLIAGLMPRARGEVQLNGTPMSRLSRREVAQNLALVEQHADTDEALTARDAAELGRTPWLSALRPFGPADSAIVDQALEMVGMSHMADAAWDTLSGGERQRIHIARALAQQPGVLLLDEPTNHLDIHHQLSLLQLVRSLPVTVILALHDLNQAMECDRLGVMQGGRLIACGPPQEVLDPALLAQSFRVGARVLTDSHDSARLFRFHCIED